MSDAARHGASNQTMVLRAAGVGVINTTLDIVLFAALTQVGGMAVQFANIFSYSAGIITSFVLHKYWTFSHTSHKETSAWGFALFVLVNLTGLTLSTVLVVVFSMYINEVIAKVITVPIVFVWNFLASKYLVFR